MKKYLFIVNPTAGRGKGRKVWKKIKKQLEKQNVSYRSFMTQYAGHAEEIALQTASLQHRTANIIVAVGGDGTVHEVINGLSAHPSLAVGFIPAGSGNDFARGFAVPKSPKKALQKLLVTDLATITQYDLGEYQLGRRRTGKGLFVTGMGIGFDGEVAKMTNSAPYKSFFSAMGCGTLAYVLSVLRLLRHYQPRRVVVEIDGREQAYSNVWLVAVSNIPYYGGGFKISPQASPADGKFSICIAHNLNKWKLLLMLGTVFWGWHRFLKEVTLLEGRSIKVSSFGAMTIHTDGEIIGETPISVDVKAESRSLC